MGSNPYNRPTETGVSKKAVAGDRILLGFSGAAGSTAAAIILQEQGYSVELLHIDFSKTFSEKRPEFSCITDRKMIAEKIAAQLGLPLSIVPGDGVFQQKVIAQIQENSGQALGFEPCSSCHSRFRLELLFAEAKARNIDAIATGHFVRISREPDLGISLWRSKDSDRDQSFLLSRARKVVLKSMVTPLGHMKTADIDRMLELREISLQLPKVNELFCHSKKNLGIKYLAERCAWAVDRERRAYAVTADLKALAEIKMGGELPYYWGQSEDLEHIRQEASMRGYKTANTFVVTAVDPMKHYVYVGPPKHLRRREIVLENVHWIVAPDLRKPRQLSFVSRGQRVANVFVEPLIDNAIHLRVSTEEDYFEVGPGDLGTLYEKELCMGSGEVYSGF